MLTIIPAIDLIDGKCVRLSKGDYDQKTVYNEDPLEVAKAFQDHGLQRLHLVDLDGAKEKHVVNWRMLDKIASKTDLIIDFGGGIKTDEDIEVVFNSGANMATIGSIAVTDKTLFYSWFEKYGPDRIILGADVNEKKIAVAGWLETTDMELFEFLEEYLSRGVKHVLCTDISKDGMLEGTSMELYEELLQKFPDIGLIASGGIASINELHILDKMNVSGAIIGKAIYEGKITLKDLQEFTTRK